MGRGVNVIKILATERSGLPQADPLRRMFTDEELNAAVDEAYKTPVMAHAQVDEGAAAAIRAGVRSIEHGTFLSDRTLALMKERRTFFVPTIAVNERDRETGGPQGNPLVSARAAEMLPRSRAVTAKAWRLGVPIVAGSDFGYVDRYRLQDELVELVNAGIRPSAVIKAATSIAAECLMINMRTGSIKPGLEADLVVLDHDPRADIKALRDVLLVVNNGKVVVNRLNR